MGVTACCCWRVWLLCVYSYCSILHHPPLLLYGLEASSLLPFLHTGGTDSLLFHNKAWQAGSQRREECEQKLSTLRAAPQPPQQALLPGFRCTTALLSSSRPAAPHRGARGGAGVVVPGERRRWPAVGSNYCGGGRATAVLTYSSRRNNYLWMVYLARCKLTNESKYSVRDVNTP